MMEPLPDDKEEAALEALAVFGRNSARAPTREELDAGLVRLRARLGRASVYRQRAYWTAAAAMLFVAVLGLALGQDGFGFKSPALTFRVDGGQLLDDGYLRQSGQVGVTLVFSEGTRVVLEPGSAGRLQDVDATGARVAIERGAATFEVTPNRGAHWLVELGPFMVMVKGTAFFVAWDPTTQRFELDLRRGEVAVRGPLAGGELSLKAGQRLLVDVVKADTLITEHRARELPVASEGGVVVHESPPAAIESPAAVVSASAELSERSAAPSARALRAAPSSRWAAELAEGRWDKILEDAEQAGIESTLNSATSEELAALADAARYRRRSGLAREALLAQRRRFPESRRALDATFLLGRVEEEQPAGTGRAIAWYDEYLARAPQGSYAAEALVRKMTIFKGSSNPAAAAVVAREYLRRFPAGRYAGSARALLGER